MGFSLLQRLVPLSLLPADFTGRLVGAPDDETRRRIMLAYDLFVAALAVRSGTNELAALEAVAQQCAAPLTTLLRGEWRRAPAVLNAPPPIDAQHWKSVAVQSVWEQSTRGGGGGSGGGELFRTVEVLTPLAESAVLTCEADGAPVAALQLRIRSGTAASASAAAAAVLHVLSDGKLQAMLAHDDVEVEFVATNLLTTQAIKLELVPTAAGLGNVPVAQPLNAGCDILEPGQSSVIDRFPGGRALCVKEVRVPTADGPAAPVDVATELGRSPSDMRGSYVTVRVSAPSDGTSRFARTRWSVSSEIRRDVTPFGPAVSRAAAAPAPSAPAPQPAVPSAAPAPASTAAPTWPVGPRAPALPWTFNFPLAPFNSTSNNLAPQQRHPFGAPAPALAPSTLAPALAPQAPALVFAPPAVAAPAPTGIAPAPTSAAAPAWPATVAAAPSGTAAAPLLSVELRASCVALLTPGPKLPPRSEVPSAASGWPASSFTEWLPLATVGFSVKAAAEAGAVAQPAHGPAA